MCSTAPERPLYILVWRSLPPSPFILMIRMVYPISTFSHIIFFYCKTRIVIVNLMSWKQKRRDSVGCFGQIENIKRQSLVYTNYRLLPNKANHCSMNYQDKDLQSYIKYWNHDFQKVLLWYYWEWLSDNNSCIHNMILSGDKHRSFSEIRRTQLLSLINNNYYHPPVDDGLKYHRMSISSLHRCIT